MTLGCDLWMGAQFRRESKSVFVFRRRMSGLGFPAFADQTIGE